MTGSASDVPLAFNRCCEAFASRDYWGVVDLANAIPEGARPRAAFLLSLIALMRSDRAPESVRVQAEYLRHFDDRFSKLLLEIAVEGKTVEEALRSAGQEEKRDTAQFYRAQYLETIGRGGSQERMLAALHPGVEGIIARRQIGIRDDTDAPAEHCVAAFETGHCEQCWQVGLEAIARKLADPLTIQLTILALAREGYEEATQSVGRRALLEVSNEWERLLIMLTLDRLTYEEVVSHAPDKESRAAAAFLAGGRMVADQRRKATRLLRECLEANPCATLVALARCELERHDLATISVRDVDRIIRPWPQIRVFISSTFRDMHAEREQLVRFVFPHLRLYCARRRLLLFDLDLRWGVATEENSTARCLQELEKSDIFVCMIGDRYGFVELPDQLPLEDPPVALSAKIRGPLERFYPGGKLRDGLTDADRLAAIKLIDSSNLIEILSITETEIRTALSKPDMQCLFFLREPEVTATVPASHASDYRTENAWKAKKSDRLRSMLASQKHHPVQSYGKGMRWSDTSLPPWQESRGGHFVELGDFDARVRKELETAIDAIVARTEQGEVIDEEEWAMEAVVQEHLHSRLFAGRQDDLQKLNTFIADPSPTVACVHGPSGAGKTALLAQFIWSLGNSGNVAALWHFVAATPESARPLKILQRLARKLGASEDRLAGAGGDRTKLRALVESLLAVAAADQTVVVILDGLDQLDRSAGDDLDWIPWNVPAKVRLIVSVVHEGKSGADISQWAFAQLARTREFRKIPLGDLTPPDCDKVISSYLVRYGKSVAAIKKNARGELVEKAQARLPLYLVLALDELRTLGGNDLHLRVEGLIASLPESVETLFNKSLDRILDFNQNYPDLTKCVLTVLCLNHHAGGTTELELDHMATMVGGVGSSGAYARIIVGLRGHLIERPDRDGNLLLAFRHDRLLRATKEWLVLNTAQSSEEASRFIARALRSLGRGSGDNPWQGPPGAAELMFRLPFALIRHLLAGGQARRAAALLCDPVFIAAICNRGQVQGLIEAFAQVSAADPDTDPRAPFGDARPPADWVRAATRSIIEGRSRTEVLEGGGPLLANLRRNAQVTAPVYVWDIETGEVRAELTGHLWDVTSAALTSDARWGITACADRTLRVWDIAAGRCARMLQLGRSSPLSVDLTDDGAFAFSLDSGGTLCSWSLAEDRLVDKVKLAPGRIHVSADGLFAVACLEHEWRVHDLVDGTIRSSSRSRPCHASAVAKLAERLVTLHSGGVASVWHTRLQARMLDLTDPEMPLGVEHNCVAMTADGNIVAVGSSDGFVRCWDVVANELVWRVRTQDEAVAAVDLNADGSILVAGGDAGGVSAYRLGQELWAVHSAHAASAIATSADGRTALIAGKATALREARAAAGRMVPVPTARPLAEAAKRAGGGVFEKAEIMARLVSAHVKAFALAKCDAIALLPRATEEDFIARRAQRLLSRRRTPWIDSLWWPTVNGAHAIRTTLLVHQGDVHEGFKSVAVDASGSCVATVPAWSPEVQVWDMIAKSMRFSFRDLPSAPTIVAVSPDGTHVLAGAENGALYTWDAHTGRVRGVLDAGPGEIKGLHFTTDGALVASLSAEGSLSLWDVEGLARVRNMQAPLGGESLVLSCDGLVAITSSHAGEHTVWDTDLCKPRRTFFHDEYSQEVVALSADACTAISSTFQDLLVWAVDTGIVWAQRKHEGHFLVASDDAEVGLWSDTDDFHLRSIADGALVGSFPKVGWAVDSGMMTREAAVVGAVDHRETLRAKSALLILDLAAAKSYCDTRPEVALRGVARSQLGAVVVYISGPSEITVANADTQAIWRRINVSDMVKGRNLITLALSSDGRTLAFAGQSHDIGVVDIATGRLLFTLGSPQNHDVQAGHIEAILHLVFSPDGHLLASGSQDATARVWSVESRSLVRTLGKPFSANRFQGHWMPVMDVAFSPNGRELVSVGLEGLVHIWDVATGVSRKCLNRSIEDDPPGAGCNAVAYAMDGRYFATAHENSSIQVWDAVDGTMVALHAAAATAFTLACLTPTGRFICADQRHRAWGIDLCNFELAPPLVTAGIPWRARGDAPLGEGPMFQDGDVIPGDMESAPAFTCPYCRKRSTLGHDTLDFIASTAHDARVPPQSSLSLHLPDAAWTDPRLATPCQHCGGAVSINPFLARYA